MKKKLLLFSLIIITSCSATKIVSNKAPGFNEKIARLYIIINRNENYESYFEPIIKEFEERLNEKKIPTRKYFLSSLSLESDEYIKKQADYFEPNLVMIMSNAEFGHQSTYMSNGYSSGINNGVNPFMTTQTKVTNIVDIKIIKPDSKKVVWRGNLKISGYYSTDSEIVDKLINKLTEDQLL